MNVDKNKIGTVKGIEVYELFTAPGLKEHPNTKVYELAGVRMFIVQLWESQRTVFIIQHDSTAPNRLEHQFSSCREIDVLAFAQLVLDYINDPVSEGSFSRLTSKLDELYATFPPSKDSQQQYRNPLINPGMIVITNMEIYPLPAPAIDTLRYKTHLVCMPVTPRLVVKQAMITCTLHFKGDLVTSATVEIDAINNIELPEIFADLQELEISIPQELSYNLVNIMQVIVAHWNEEFTKEFIDFFTFGQSVGMQIPSSRSPLTRRSGV